MPPSDALIIAVTTGLGVSVIAGVLSGICYILSHGVPPKRKKRPRTPWHCNVCRAQFRSIQGVLEVEKVVTCAKCGEKVCRVKCSLRDPRRGWICQSCQQPETWFKGLLKAMHPSNTQGWFSTRMDADAIDELDEDLMELRKKEREQVRDFIERLVGSMLGGNLDDVNVGKLYNDKKYLPITGQTPCTAHASLKLLIQRFIREAVELPELKKHLDHPALPEEHQDDRTYEDLLSTAIINKVVQNYQNEKRPHSSAANSVCSRASSSARKSDREYFFSEETLETKWKAKHSDVQRDESSSTSSSLEDWVKSDSSVGSSKFVDRVSLTIKQQIDEGSSSDDGSRRSRRSQRSSLLMKPPEDTWSDNWFLQKRIAGTHSPVPVPMLVPNPTVEAKVLIGDRDAEDTSDLSDACSDFGDTEVVPDIKNILVNSRTIIGGKNVLEKAVATAAPDPSPSKEEEEERENENVEAENVTKENHVEAEEGGEAKAELRPEDGSESGAGQSAEAPPSPGNEDAPLLLSLESNTEQDTEYTEQYGSLPRTILKSPKPTPRASKFKEKTDCVDGPFGRREGVQDTVASDGDVSESSDDDDDGGAEKLRSFKGSYSEREKEKWKHAVDIPNNPYAPEKLESRLSNRSDDSVGSLYGRDYYVREASRSAGARKKSEPQDFEAVDLIEFDDGSDEIKSELVTAVPVFVLSEEEEEEAVDSCKTPTPQGHLSPSPTQNDADLKGSGKDEDEVRPTPNWQSFPLYAQGEDDSRVRPNQLEISSDSDLSIERIYNLESGRVIQKVGLTSQEMILMGSRSPEGIRYTPKEFDEDFHRRRKTIDENHNDTKAKKREFLRSLTQDDDEFVDGKRDVTPLEGDDEKKVPYAILNVEMIKDEIEMAPPPPKCFGEMKKLMDNKEVKTSDYSEEEEENKDFSLEYSTDLGEHESASPSDSLLETDPEILDLKEKRLVKDVLGKLSRSFSSLPTTTTNAKLWEDFSTNEKRTPSPDHVDMPSVRNLKKLFDKESVSAQQPKNKDQKQVHSLTARSLPKQFRQELKSTDDDPVANESLKVNGSVAEQDNEEEEEEVVEQLPADITRNRIAFFEQLRRT